MDKLIGACIIGQSGGPSAVINSSAYGVIKTAMEEECITHVYAAQHGIKGILDDDIIDMEKEDSEELELLLSTPSSLIGSCRYKLKPAEEDETDYKRILEIFTKYDIRYFFYNGGNDSMDTCNKISKYLSSHNYPCRIMGVPKTIDNDLYATDHCPGFGSSAKYIATSISEVIQDVNVYDKEVIVIVEVMGRHAGWLAGSAALSKLNGGEGPALIYLPEVVFDMDKFFADFDEIRKNKKHIVIVMSEGIHDKDGKFISEYSTLSSDFKDSFGHVQLGGLAATMTHIIRERTGAKVRGIELSLLQRCAAHCSSKTDRDEAFLAGKAALEAAVAGETDKMVAFECDRENGYTCKTVLVPLDSVANYEKAVPREWINEDGNNVNEKFFEYALPLIQGEIEQKYENGIPRHAKLKRIKAEI